jgi:hypothetical protein
LAEEAEEAVLLAQVALEIMVEAMALPALGPAGLVVVVLAALVEVGVEPAAAVVRQVMGEPADPAVFTLLVCQLDTHYMRQMA